MRPSRTYKWPYTSLRAKIHFASSETGELGEIGESGELGESGETGESCESGETGRCHGQVATKNANELYSY